MWQGFARRRDYATSAPLLKFTFMLWTQYRVCIARVGNYVLYQKDNCSISRLFIFCRIIVSESNNRERKNSESMVFLSVGVTPRTDHISNAFLHSQRISTLWNQNNNSCICSWYNRKGIKVLPLVALIVDYQWMCMYRILFSYHGICWSKNLWKKHVQFRLISTSCLSKQEHMPNTWSIINYHRK